MEAVRESENVCNMPELLHLEVHRSKETGLYYIAFIDHTETTCDNRGYWTDREITGEDLTALLRMCYPQWDGKDIPFRSGDESQQCNICMKACEHSQIYRTLEELRKA